MGMRPAWTHVPLAIFFEVTLSESLLPTCRSFLPSMDPTCTALGEGEEGREGEERRGEGRGGEGRRGEGSIGCYVELCIIQALL